MAFMEDHNANAISQDINSLFAKYLPRDPGGILDSGPSTIKSVSEFEDALLLGQSMMNQVAFLVRDVRIRRNGFIPLHRLPPEVVVVILSHVLPTAESITYYLKLTQLRLVCHIWKSIIDNAPTLWRAFPCTLPKRAASVVLQKSRSGPLSVTCLCNYMPPKSPFEVRLCANAGIAGKTVPLWLTAGDHCHRWTSLVIRHQDTSTISQYLKLPLSNLQTLDIVCGFRDRPTRTFQLFGGETPFLRSLHVFRYSLPWDLIPCSHLRSIKLIGDTGEIITAKEICKMICSAPRLEDLSITTPIGGEERHTAPFANSVLVPRLRNLSLQWFTMHFLLEVFSIVELDFRHLDSLVLRIIYPLYEDDVFFLILAQSLRKVHLHHQLLDVHYSGLNLSFRWGKLSLAFSFPHGSDVESAMTTIFENCINPLLLQSRLGVTRLSITTRGTGMTRPCQQLAVLLDQYFPAIEELSLVSPDSPWLEELLEHLAQVDTPRPYTALLSIKFDLNRNQYIQDSLLDALHAFAERRAELDRTWTGGETTLERLTRLLGIIREDRVSKVTLTNY